MDEARSVSMPPSPEKKKPRAEVQSVICSAIEINDKGGLGGLMRFFKPCMKAEYDEQVTRFTEEHHENLEQREMQEAMKKQMRNDRLREGDRLLQQKHQQTKHHSEIVQGERTPGGTKRKVCPVIFLIQNAHLDTA